MPNSTNTKHKELLNTQNSVEETHNSNSNYEREQIPNTPFWVIGTKEEGYNLIMGKWKLTTTPLKTKKELTTWMNKNDWNIVLSMIICATQDIHDQNTNSITQQALQKYKQNHPDTINVKV